MAQWVVAESGAAMMKSYSQQEQTCPKTRVPETYKWSKSILFPIPKKSDRMQYWGISLLNILEKIFAPLLPNRIAKCTLIKLDLELYWANFYAEKDIVSDIKNIILRYVLKRLCYHFFWFDRQNCGNSCRMILKYFICVHQRREQDCACLLKRYNFRTDRCCRWLKISATENWGLRLNPPTHRTSS